MRRMVNELDEVKNNDMAEINVRETRLITRWFEFLRTWIPHFKDEFPEPDNRIYLFRATLRR